MKRKFLFVTAIALSVALVSVMGTSAKADGSALPKPAGINSQGRIVYDKDNDQVYEIIFDAQDIYYLHKISQ